MNCLAQRKKFKNKHPVWSDPTDPKTNDANNIQADEESLKEAHKDASDASSDSSSDEGDCDMYANDIRSKKFSLETKDLRYKHLTDLNNERSYKGGVKQVQFHPTSKVALVSLTIGQADLFEVDGERNRYLQNIKLPRTKMPFCSFKPDGNSIVICSESYRGAFYTYDMITNSIKKYLLKVGREAKEMTDFTMHNDYMACRLEGKQEIFVLSSKTFDTTFSLKINDPVKTVKFSENNEMFIAGENGQVYVWDLRKTSVCKHRFQDEGTVHINSLSLSETSKLLAIGSDCGIVNTYELGQCLTDKYPTPIKTFNNLKSPVDILDYNFSGELLLIGSRSQGGAFRLIHSHSGLVYKNFPSNKKKYKHLLSADFSPLGGYLALGCSSGRAHLCRIPYYQSY